MGGVGELYLGKAPRSPAPLQATKGLREPRGELWISSGPPQLSWFGVRGLDLYIPRVTAHWF